MKIDKQLQFVIILGILYVLLSGVGPPAKPLRSYGSRGSMGPQYPYDQLYSIPGIVTTKTINLELKN